MEFKQKAEEHIQSFAKWGQSSSLIKGIALVGSCARGDFSQNSDVDLVIVAENQLKAIEAIRTASVLGHISNFQIEDLGEITSLRVNYVNGLEVEYGLAAVTWSEVPLDPMTQKVVREGFQVVLDKCHVFDNIHAFIRNN